MKETYLQPDAIVVYLAVEQAILETSKGGENPNTVDGQSLWG